MNMYWNVENPCLSRKTHEARLVARRNRMNAGKCRLAGGQAAVQRAAHIAAKEKLLRKTRGDLGAFSYISHTPAE